MTNWIIFAGLSVVVVPADSADGARKDLLERMGFTSKPYLARDWVVREATLDDLRMYAAFSDAVPPSEPTAQSVARKRKRTSERLGMWDEGGGS